MSAKIEYRDGHFHIDIPAAEAYQDENLSAFLDSNNVRKDYSRPQSPSELGDAQVRESNAETERYGNNEAF